MARALLNASSHRERAESHALAGENLVEAGQQDWAAVCFFYAAYHLIKAALLEDAIFEDIDRLHAKHHDLQSDDRYSDKHKGRRAGHGWGVNELVQLLYPSITRPYERLHQASIDVRYRKGLRGRVEDLRDSLAEINTAAASGGLKAS